MNIIKKMSLVLPVAAISLFIFTLSVIKNNDDSAQAGININYTSTQQITLITSESSRENLSDSMVPSTSAEIDSSISASPAVTEAPNESKNIPVSVVTPFSKLPELAPLDRIEPIPVVTPSEIILESIPLINHNTTIATSETTVETKEATSSCVSTEPFIEPLTALPLFTAMSDIEKNAD